MRDLHIGSSTEYAHPSESPERPQSAGRFLTQTELLPGTSQSLHLRLGGGLYARETRPTPGQEGDEATQLAAEDARLLIPYQDPPATETPGDLSSSLSSTLPMAAMFTRSKMIGWASFIVAIQNWLGESEQSKRGTAMPGIFTVGMSFMALTTTYMSLFIPPVGQKGAAPAAATA
ncbi:hypothetical protein GMORB2_5323 [Geosmithia morbida]|uniref:Protein Asterix n=1 Tax=Geosmithia morbida TaxID=1094350 RepID=A0A9P4YZJ2_9HYPO|nr:uncharacterized protein GMORB2_5323 [Geosmithia morbida]KAF4124657.1 hypothetical protein GMORB2_5323 [Geosmithia morbida]